MATLRDVLHDLVDLLNLHPDSTARAHEAVDRLADQPAPAPSAPAPGPAGDTGALPVLPPAVSGDAGAQPS